MTNDRPAEAGRVQWLDALKGVAMLWIILNHLSEAMFGYPHIANPTRGWPPLADRFAQLAPLTEFGIWNVPVNAARWLGWIGDQGVQLFVIASGYLLAWSLLTRSGATAPVDARAFYRRRLLRLYPPWWTAHVVFIFTGLVGLPALVPVSREFVLSFLGFRGTPELLYWFAPAWWFVWLLLQLYLVFPFLQRWMVRIGPARFLWRATIIGIVARLVGLLACDAWFPGWLDAWSRGIFFISRLPEFALGMALASWATSAAQRPPAWLRAIGPAALVYMVGLVLSISLVGMSAAPFLLGAGAFALVGAGVRAWPRGAGRTIIDWIGRNSYGTYLVHHPVIVALALPRLDQGEGSVTGAALRCVVAVLGSLVAGYVLERLAAPIGRVVQRVVDRTGFRGLIVRAGAAAAVVGAVLVVSELAVRRWDPQEVNGWGERSALEPHDVFGWRLVPNRETRLRWLSYDYIVDANALGFPGPAYPEARQPGSLRVLVTGDAFSSAEGVDTDRAWPRLLERRLAGPERPAEVLDFAITGYGPNQYAAVVEAFAPRFAPDVVIVELFVNDLFDVQVTNEQFQHSIGFDQPAQDSLGSIARLLHLRAALQIRVREPLLEKLRGRPRAQGYFLANYRAFERDQDLEDNTAAVRACLERVRAVADGIGADLRVILVPASVQVCAADELPYAPRTVDPAHMDMDQPQRIFATMCESLGIPALDLRSALRDCTDCPYFDGNMHWTAGGHEAVAEAVARDLADASAGGAP